MLLHRHRAGTGFALIEAIAAAFILGFISLAVIAGLTFNMRMARLNTNAMMAKNIAQGFFEQMNTDVFANLAPANYPDVAAGSNPPVWLDQALGIRCEVDFEFKGFGQAEDGTAGSLVDNDPLSPWQDDEWVGGMLYLVDGRGAGQFRPITANTADTLTLGGGSLSPPPDSSTKYMINNGKTIEITTTWQYMGKSYSQSMRSLVMNYRGDANLGF